MQAEKAKHIEALMRLALELAEATPKRVSPNPRTGALIFRGTEVLGQGRHEYFGGPHAEVNAIRNAGVNLQGAGMVVTLEPCCHHGKTAPCTDAIIKAGISEVYVGMRDPNPLVAGKGIEILKAAGIRVRCGILRESCEDVNQPFIKMMTVQLPYVIAKAAITLDGFMADRRGNSKWISSAGSRRMVHKMRSEYDAVLVGMGTVLADDPELTVRDIAGDQPLRVIYDPRGSLSAESKLIKSINRAALCIICGKKASEEWKKEMDKYGVRLIAVEDTGSKGLIAGLRELGRQGIQSVLVEGGAAVHNMLAAEDAIDRLELFIAPKLLGKGLPAMKIPGHLMSQAKTFYSAQWRQSGPDMHFSGIFKHYTGEQ